MNILMVVRRFGDVGGMERYVLKTAIALKYLGNEVEVVCEKAYSKAPAGIVVHEIGAVASRPRWLALLRFGMHVDKWLQSHPRPGWLIHSHERLRCHHVTTFHGQSFATIFQKHWTRLLSVRVWMHLYLEYRELAVAERIIPASELSRKLLSHYFPSFAHKLTAPIIPGVDRPITLRSSPAPQDGGVVAFVGKEWKRKGLQKAIAVFESLKATRKNLQLVVMGPAKNEIKHLLHNNPNDVEILGWRDAIDYSRFDVLLHPAHAEPFGMVVAEAMAARVPVVVSNQCGVAAIVHSTQGCVVDINADIGTWTRAVDAQLARGLPDTAWQRDWRQVAGEYCEVYKTVPCCNPFTDPDWAGRAADVSVRPIGH